VTRRVIISKRAEREIRLFEAWWVENRPDAPDLFYRELRHALRLLGDHPEIGQSVPLRRHPTAHRYLLSGTLRHLYYDFTEDTLEILSVWGAVRRTKPSPP
jgi:plasmid stabilization system protein ParE